MSHTVYRYYDAEKSYDEIFTWAQSNLTSEELADLNLAFQRNTDKYSVLLENNLIIENPIIQEFYSNVLQANITSIVGTAVTYNLNDDNQQNFQQDSRWEYYLDRYLTETSE